MGSLVKPAMGMGMGKTLNTHGFTHAIPYICVVVVHLMLQLYRLLLLFLPQPDQQFLTRIPL